MTKKDWLFVTFLILVIIGLGLAATFPRMKFYLISAQGGSGELLWKGGEAYLFMHDRTFGYHLTGADLLAEPIKEYFYSSATAVNHGYALTIIHITSSGVERYVQKAGVPITSFTPLGDTIYADCPGGMCRWNGVQFELVPSQDELRMGGRDHLRDDWYEFNDANGWSKRRIRDEGPMATPIHGQYSVEPGGQFTLLVTEGQPTSVVLQRPNNKSKESLWHYSQGLSVVSKAKYERVFGPS